MKLILISLTLLLTGCAAPKRPVYDQPDAATIMLSMTSDFSMSKVVLWGMQLEPVEPKHAEEIGPFAFSVSSRIYRRSPAEKQFLIRGADEYGMPFESQKFPPGKYRITAINVQRNLGAGLDAMSSTVMSAAKNGRNNCIFESTCAKALPDIVIDLKPGSVNYIGSFRAYLDNCEGLTVLCSGYRVEIRETLTRDASLLEAAGRGDKIILNTIKLDRRNSPHFYSVD